LATAVAWRVAKLARVKHIPSLESLMVKPDQKTRPTQSLKQQRAIVVALNQRFGGLDLRAKKNGE